MTTIPETIKRNMIRTLEHMSLSSPRIVFERTPRAIRYESDLPHPLYNRVIAYEGADEAGADADIGAIAKRYRERGLPLSWLTWSHDRDAAGLARALEAHGFKKAGVMTGMSLPLADWTPDVPAPAGMDIRPVRTESDFAWLEDVILPAFGLEGEAGEVFMRINKIAGTGEDAAFRHYVGFLDGGPAGAATAVHDGETIGIYNVATSEGFRRRGIGSVLTAHAVREGQAAGGRLAVLQASGMGLNVYRQLGFRDDAEIGLYLG
ncbi:Ribosomal protein S18 acetylase RimI [Paenibacillus sp. UNC496MF]|uniref:GNAT family N-acetyltransferase n=1 Tax=Paenibacillus sp. UNC496MF TaxID=1502753 RepID=UPI0008F2B453|nr:GNAT family N-acetyltransferase [Paenibacillus sp. UNC496MF]SFI37306.1 Ribosomal protein S18 acetylase RimI [Paenibacillus sp. UNC496MF]